MKSVRLPETEVANLAFRPYDFKVAFLSNWLRPKPIAGSYGPLRRSVGEAANTGLPLLPEIEPTTLEQLESLVVKECKGSQKLINMNVAPARAIRALVGDLGAQADSMIDLPITLYPGMRYSFWSPMLVRYDGLARIVFLDLRRTGYLTASGLHTCFSIMHERFRALNPDYESVKFEAWRFANSTGRKIRVISESLPPIDYDRIVADVAETYSILDWLRTAAPLLKTGTDDSPGPLFG